MIKQLPNKQLVLCHCNWGVFTKWRQSVCPVKQHHLSKAEFISSLINKGFNQITFGRIHSEGRIYKALYPTPCSLFCVAYVQCSFSDTSQKGSRSLLSKDLCLKRTKNFRSYLPNKLILKKFNIMRGLWRKKRSHTVCKFCRDLSAEVLWNRNLLEASS